MERQNEKVRSENKAEERKKFLKIYDLAKKHDPRLRRRKQQAEEEQKKKQEKREQDRIKKLLAQAKREEEERIAQEQEKKRLQEERQNQRLEQEKAKQAEEEIKREIRNICTPYSVLTQTLTKKQVGVKILAEHVEYVIARLDTEQQKKLIEKLKPIKSAEEFASVFNGEYSSLKKGIEVKAAAQQEEHNASQTKEGEKEWTHHELMLLSKAIALYPGGSQQRWVKVAQHVGTRTPEEVQHKTAEIRKKPIEVVPKRDEKEYFGEFKNAKDSGATTKKKDQEQKMQEQYQEQLKLKQQNAVRDVENWTNEQQKALETAMRTFKDLKGDEKWAKIAGAIGNKTKEQCLERFNYCKQLALAKKNAK
jgi:DnaJ family protein C protein 2